MDNFYTNERYKGVSILKRYLIILLVTVLWGCVSHDEIKDSSSSSNAISSGENHVEAVFADPFQQPEFFGGMVKLMEYLQKEKRYPEECLNQGIQGRVLLTFEVDVEGRLER